jgi:hypothetical protein
VTGLRCAARRLNSFNSATDIGLAEYSGRRAIESHGSKFAFCSPMKNYDSTTEPRGHRKILHRMTFFPLFVVLLRVLCGSVVQKIGSGQAKSEIRGRSRFFPHRIGCCGGGAESSYHSVAGESGYGKSAILLMLSVKILVRCPTDGRRLV